jgi:4-aminobutyrate aminotransferase
MCIVAARAERRDAEAFALSCARYIEDKLFKTILPRGGGGVFIEPVQGEGGYVVAPTPFMQELRRICDKHGILLVVDKCRAESVAPASGGRSTHRRQPDICSAKALRPACRWA